MAVLEWGLPSMASFESAETCTILPSTRLKDRGAATRKNNWVPERSIWGKDVSGGDISVSCRIELSFGGFWLSA